MRVTRLSDFMPDSIQILVDMLTKVPSPVPISVLCPDNPSSYVHVKLVSKSFYAYIRFQKRKRNMKQHLQC